MSSVNAIEQYKDALLADLDRLVNLDSFSYDKEDVDRVGAEFRKLLERSGCEILVNESAEYGNSIMGTVYGTGTIRIMMLGHMDTVHKKGATTRYPYRVEGDIAYGPGTEDMKAADLMGCYTIQMLQDLDYRSFGKLSMLINSDEEIGSPSSRAFIEEQARQHDVVLVLEGPQTRREIVSRRKGSAKYVLTVHGQAAHAGVEPELGRNALLELAHQIIGLQTLNAPDKGTTVNVCLAEGGVAANVIPPSATATIDVRVLNAAEAERISAAIKTQIGKTTVPDVTCTLEGDFVRPPMEKTDASAKLIELAQKFAEDCGFPLKEITMGGGTDGNFTAAIGVPTLDGLGPDGGLSHSEREFLEIPSIWERMAVLTMLIRHLSENGM
jgi:glutamate carboxypeptidase